VGVVGWVEVSVEGAEVAGGFAGCGGVGAGEGFYFHDGWMCVVLILGMCLVVEVWLECF